METRLNVKIPAELHRALRIYCVTNGKTMAEAAVLALQMLLSSEAKSPA